MTVGGSRSDIYDNLGYSGLPRFGGFVFDDFLPELQGPRGRRVIREMADNDATIGAILFGFQMLSRRLTWTIRPDEDAPDDDRAEFIDQCRNDMAVPWADRLSEILSFLPYGWALHEQIYKKRDGKNSKHADGKIGWYDWPLRGQETLLKWEFDDAGGILGMWQLGPPDYREVFIPMGKALLFRTSVVRGNPEGRSILRNAYTSWFFKKNIQIFEGIGVERDLAGIPYLRIPGQILEAAANPNATPQDIAALRAYQEMGRQVRVNEGHCVILPSDVDPQTKTPMYEFTTVGSPGQKQFDTSEIINRYKLDTTQTVLADFLQVGHESEGSHALAESKTSLFAAALGAMLHQVTAPVNDVAIPRLLRLNGMSTDFAPTLQHSEVGETDLAALGKFIASIAAAGFQLDTSWDGNLLDKLLERADLPKAPATKPEVLNEPVTVYEQPVDQQTPEGAANAAAAMPHVGKRRGPPQRPGQPAGAPAPGTAPAKASEPASGGDATTNAAAAALIVHATRQKPLADVLHAHMVQHYQTAYDREAKRHGAEPRPISDSAQNVIRGEADWNADSITDTYGDQVDNAEARGETQQQVDNRRDQYKPAEVLGYTAAVAKRMGMLDFYRSPDAAQTPTASTQRFHVEPTDYVCETCGDLVGMGSFSADAAESVNAPAHGRCPHEIVPD